MKKKSIIITVALLTIITLVFLIKSCSLFQKKTEYTLATVKRGHLINKLSASGTAKAEKEVNLKFQTSGKLAWVGVKEGDFVEQWQVVAQLDLEELEKTLQKYLRDYSKERWDFEQEREDYGVNTDNLDRYTLTNEVRRILEKNQFDLDKAVLDVEIKEIALKYATLVSPISGIVTQIDTPIPGVNITPATATFAIVDPQSVYFSANIDEIDIDKVHLHQKTKISLDSFPDQEFESEVAKINFASVKTSGGGTAFPVKIPLPENQDLRFKVGMNGDLEIILEEKEDALFVPSSSVIERKEIKYLWLVENDRAKKKEVKTGLETEEETEILEGVKEGEKVIAKDVSKIKEGERVDE